jgi:hypothetical protein
VGPLPKLRDLGELGMPRVVYGQPVARKEVPELLGISDPIKAWLRIVQEEASSEASMAQV